MLILNYKPKKFVTLRITLNHLRMKLQKILFSALISSFLLSCNDEETSYLENNSSPTNSMALNLKETLSLNQNLGKELSEQDILKILEDYVKDINQNSISCNNTQTRTISKSPKFKVSNKYYLGDNQTTRSNTTGIKAPVYEVQIDNGNETKGLAIVGGDDRYPVVIAYIPSYQQENPNKKTEQIPVNTDFMLGLSKAVYKDNLEQIASAQTNKKQTIEKIAKGLNIPVSDVDSQDIDAYIQKYGIERNPVEQDLTNIETRTDPSSPMDEPASKLVRSYGKPCGTEWDQWSPYNLDYPIDWVAILGPDMCSKTQHPAGCAVTAIAQIIAALQPGGMTCNGIQMRWDYLKEKKRINAGPFGDIDPKDKIDMVSALFKDIYDKTNSYPQWGTGSSDEWPPQEVQCVLQTGTNSTDIYNYFSSKSGVTVVNNNITGMMRWDPEIIRQSLQYSFPVFVGGNGHAFVLDEFLYCTKKLTTYELIKQYDVYFHANFGWTDTLGNGYYLVKDTQNGTIIFHTGLGDYKDSDMQILPFIGSRTL